MTRALSTILGDQRPERARAVAGAIGYLHEAQGLVGSLALLRPAIEPFSRGLSDLDLVELLKRPFVVGPARRVILDQLGYHHQRTFADQWDFIRFAEENKLGLDFMSPPRGP
jgi:hypothetical protein